MEVSQCVKPSPLGSSGLPAQGLAAVLVPEDTGRWLCGFAAGQGLALGPRRTAASALGNPGSQQCLLGSPCLGWCCSRGSPNTACRLLWTTLLSPHLFFLTQQQQNGRQRQERQLLLVRGTSNAAWLLGGGMPRLAEHRLLTPLPHAVSS